MLYCSVKEDKRKPYTNINGLYLDATMSSLGMGQVMSVLRLYQRRRVGTVREIFTFALRQARHGTESFAKAWDKSSQLLGSINEEAPELYKKF